jgi:hypothetical protein
MLLRRGEITPPCGVPVSKDSKIPSKIFPDFN